MSATLASYPSVTIVGGLLPAELFERIVAEDTDIPGLEPQAYGLQHNESVRRQAARSWDYLLGVWKDFQDRLADAPAGRHTELTRQRWLQILLRELDFRDVRANPGLEVDGTAFPISHAVGQVPVHLLGWQTDLDHRTPGRSARAPQSMLQELLNRSDAHLWAIFSNGAKLRLLRDSRALVGAAYVEFDLQAVFDGELFADFVLLYRICHASRFAEHGGGGPATCYLERWLETAESLGTRALNQLRHGVETAIGILGTGFLNHPDNTQLRKRIHVTHELSIEDFNRSLLRMVYRLLFWFVAEDRSVLLLPDTPPIARKRYVDYYSSARLRRLARHRGTGHDDLWDAVHFVFHALGTEDGVAHLGLAGIGGLYEHGPLDEPLDGARLHNEELLDAVRAISIVRDRRSHTLRRVDFGNLGADELGSVYESFLELIPRHDPDEQRYTLERLPGHERAGSGSYYTPDPLVQCLLNSTLDPLLDEAECAPDPETTLLLLTVCDPACGSGHFLVAAARRIAKRLAAVRTGESEPCDSAVRAALREVTGRCVYGVDINPMVVELAKVSLWLEAVEPGKPMPFLDTNIRIGNSLLGVTPRLLREGLPDRAFTVLQGDDRKVTAALKQENAAQRRGQDMLHFPDEIDVANERDAHESAAIAATLPRSLEDVHAQAARARSLHDSTQHRARKLVADAWCAAFVQPKSSATRKNAITDAVLRRLAADPADTSPELATTIESLARDYRFFHWYLEFPHIFRTAEPGADPETGWSGGFSCVIGNPPWERVKIQEKDFFASRDDSITNARNAAERKRRIAQLEHSTDQINRGLFATYQRALRHAEGVSAILHESSRYPLTGTGDVNTYAVFAETGQTITGPRGRSGMVLPTGIATDATTAPFFRAAVSQSRLVSFLEFENEAFLLSRAVDHRVRFCLLTLCGHETLVAQTSFAFGTRRIADLASRTFAMPPEEILLVNPNTGTSPLFRSRRDAEITVGIYRRVPVLWRDSPPENPWGLSFLAMFHMANDSGIFHTQDQLRGDGWSLVGNVFVRDDKRMLPLYEAKMVHHFDHRLGTYEGQTEAQANMGTLPRSAPGQKDDPNYVVLPRYWVAGDAVTDRLRGRWDQGWLLGWRDTARSTDERTLIAAAIPRGAVGDKYLLAFPQPACALLQANLSTFILDYIVRQKISGANIKYFTFKQLPVLPPSTYTETAPWLGGSNIGAWIAPRVLELVYTCHDMRPLAGDLGDDGAPFHWDEQRRDLIRAELDAAYFRLYGVDRDDVDYIMDTFSTVKRRDEAAKGEYRTKRMILEAYDAMPTTVTSGVPYHSPLRPPPGDGPRHCSE